MLKLPGTLTAATFLDRYWQKEPLAIQQALERIRPAVTRNELGWLATLDDVESRLVFTEHDGSRVRYRAETGPFDSDYLVALPKRDWTLLVHDVEKHLPALRRLFSHVSFIPDWRIDDLMVSFAAPGGGVGPHKDNYDVFLCQGIGVRDWHVATDDIAADPQASDDLALTRAFVGQVHSMREGDVLYLPPGVAHWGIAKRACITYSIGMRAPRQSDLLTQLPDTENLDPFYADPDLSSSEAVPGFIAPEAVDRALQLAAKPGTARASVGRALGRCVTQTKDWITPDPAGDQEARELAKAVMQGTRLKVHGMARIAWDRQNIYVNGASRPRTEPDSTWLKSLCDQRVYTGAGEIPAERAECLIWMLKQGAFVLPAI